MKSFKIGDLKISVPIIQGGMGVGISLSNLASAVANMGGVGVISTVGIGFLNNNKGISLKNKHIEGLRKEIQKARKQTLGVLGVNIMTVITNFSDMVKASIEEGIDIIFSGAGLPLDLPKYLNGHKTKLVPIVSSGRAASIICSKWKNNFNYLPDAFVVEGPKAGGHLGFKSEDLQKESNKLENLIDEVLVVVNNIKEKYKINIPVIAAGGLFSGKDIFNIIKRGATGVQMGTRFVATNECDASIEFKKTFINATKQDVGIIKSPVGMPGQAIYNRFLHDVQNGQKHPNKCKYQCIKTCNPKTTPYCIAEALVSAYNGDLDNGFAFAGSNASKITEITSVESVFNELEKEYITEKNKNN